MKILVFHEGLFDCFREEIREVVAEEAAEITFLNVTVIGHAVDVQTKISRGEMNVIGKRFYIFHICYSFN